MRERIEEAVHDCVVRKKCRDHFYRPRQAHYAEAGAYEDEIEEHSDPKIKYVKKTAVETDDSSPETKYY